MIRKNLSFLKIHRQKASTHQFAKADWNPTQKEKNALSDHNYLLELGRVDQIWRWLSENHGQIVAVDAPHVAHPEKLTYRELAERISIAAAAFKSFGIENGDVVALFAENSPRWLVVDQGLMRVGALDAVRGASAPVEELRYILKDSSAKALVVQTAELWEELALSESERQKLKIVIQLEGEPASGVLGWDSFLSAGIGVSLPDLMLNRDFNTASSTTATILYTSGTTGEPKGVPLSHSNLLHQMRSLACVAYPSPGSSVLSVLPIWHSYERSAEYYFFSCACTQSYTTIKHLKNDLPRVRPVVMATVPRLWEAIKIGFDDAVGRMPPLRKGLIRVALANCASYKLARRKARALLLEPISLWRRCLAVCEGTFRWPFHRLASTLIWPKVLTQLCGGELLFPINGGGAIAPHVDVFFESLGLELLVGYGLTETSPVVSCRRPWRNIRGSSGPPLPETEFRIVDPETKAPKRYYQRGLVLVKGPQVMSGYLGKEKATKDVLDSEGWLNTGDLGMLLPDGSLVLTGRAKDTIVLSNGENVEPGPLEEALLASPLVEQVMMVGQDERQLGALLVPNFEAIFEWAKLKGLDLSAEVEIAPGDENLRRILRREINELLAKRKGSRVQERVIGVALVDPFTIENGLLTMTLKQRRERITQRDHESIKTIYSRFSIS